MLYKNAYKKLCSLTAALLLVFFLSTTFYAAPGDLDTTFGSGGKVVTPVTEGTEVPTRVRIQPDGKIVTVGYNLNYGFAPPESDVAVFRPSNGVWYLLGSTTGFNAVQFGISSDVPAAADYDGDGKADIAVFRDGTWYLLQSTAGFTGIAFGLATDKPVPSAFVP